MRLQRDRVAPGFQAIRVRAGVCSCSAIRGNLALQRHDGFVIRN